MSTLRTSLSALPATVVLVAVAALASGCPAPKPTPGGNASPGAAAPTQGIVTLPESLAAGAAAGNGPGVAALLAGGADPTELDAEGRTPLDHALAHPEHEEGNLAVLTALAGALRALEDPHPERAGGTPEIDLNQIRVKLLWYDPDTLRPTEDPERGVVILKIGTKVYPDLDGEPDWELLHQDLVAFRDQFRGGSPRGLPVMVDAREQVSDAHVGRALAAAARARVSDVTLARQPWEEEIVEDPISILEEEVVIDGDDVIVDGEKHGKVVDAYGVGGGAAGAFGQRWGKVPLAREGGSEGTESATDAALRWLKRHQSPDGRWDADGWRDHCADEACAAADGAAAVEAGDGRYDEGVTALSLLAFLGNGKTHRFGEFKKTVHRALTWLKRQQKADGSIGFTEGETIYNHAFATAALCEAYAVSRDFTLKKFAQKAVDFCLIAQNPGMGWKYGVKTGRNDTGVTVAMLSALHAAKTGKLNVPSESLDGGRNWLDRATSTTGATGYQTPGGGSSYIPATKGKFDETPVNTGAAIFARLLILGQPKQEDICRRGVNVIASNPPSWPSAGETSKVNFYYWYYGTLAMFQMGGAKWREWNDALLAALVDKQRMEGCAKGAWDPVGEWCIAGGRVYATAINALTLETYYRFERRQK